MKPARLSVAQGTRPKLGSTGLEKCFRSKIEVHRTGASSTELDGSPQIFARQQGSYKQKTKEGADGICKPKDTTTRRSL